MRTILALLGLVLPLAGCGNRAGTAADMAGTAADMTDWQAAACPAPGPSTLEHACNSNASTEPCSYRDTKLVCVAYCYNNQAGGDNPLGCVGRADFKGKTGVADYICVSDCNDCQPTHPSNTCFTE